MLTYAFQSWKISKNQISFDIIHYSVTFLILRIYYLFIKCFQLAKNVLKIVMRDLITIITVIIARIWNEGLIQLLCIQHQKF